MPALCHSPSCSQIAQHNPFTLPFSFNSRDLCATSEHTKPSISSPLNFYLRSNRQDVWLLVDVSRRLSHYPSMFTAVPLFKCFRVKSISTPFRWCDTSRKGTIIHPGNPGSTASKFLICSSLKEILSASTFARRCSTFPPPMIGNR
ncbi:hypothetical protein K443DRAFT_682483 [Laccaria amethystina LaAM-08-1]|uniref:Uncharacterized protein n=1 Tax=Laccaria amethystina LaAM-08-1 TaxID=1095629 RepID=A0A0C9WKB4_9AGAR|nr:hypothetical protein K443DRAFT_682483 [Laccaria amethystina LaAM-08-1]